MLDTAFAWALVLFAPMIFAYAASSDILNMRISNLVALVFLLPFPLFAYGVGLSLADFGWHLAIGLLFFVVSFGLWSIGQIGGGDAKFITVAAIWMGPELALAFIVATSVYGAVLAIVFLLLRSKWLPAFMVKIDWILRLHNVRKIPYGVAISIAGLQVYAMSDWMSHGLSMLAG